MQSVIAEFEKNKNKSTQNNPPTIGPHKLKPVMTPKPANSPNSSGTPAKKTSGDAERKFKSDSPSSQCNNTWKKPPPVVSNTSSFSTFKPNPVLKPISKKSEDVTGSDQPKSPEIKTSQPLKPTLALQENSKFSTFLGSSVVQQTQPPSHMKPKVGASPQPTKPNLKSPDAIPSPGSTIGSVKLQSRALQSKDGVSNDTKKEQPSPVEQKASLSQASVVTEQLQRLKKTSAQTDKPAVPATGNAEIFPGVVLKPRSSVSSQSGPPSRPGSDALTRPSDDKPPPVETSTKPNKAPPPTISRLSSRRSELFEISENRNRNEVNSTDSSANNDVRSANGDIRAVKNGTADVVGTTEAGPDRTNIEPPIPAPLLRRKPREPVGGKPPSFLAQALEKKSSCNKPIDNSKSESKPEMPPRPGNESSGSTPNKPARYRILPVPSPAGKPPRKPAKPPNVDLKSFIPSGPPSAGVRSPSPADDDGIMEEMYEDLDEVVGNLTARPISELTEKEEEEEMKRHQLARKQQPPPPADEADDELYEDTGYTDDHADDDDAEDDEIYQEIG
jgi:hypothetical protein